MNNHDQDTIDTRQSAKDRLLRDAPDVMRANLDAARKAMDTFRAIYVLHYGDNPPGLDVGGLEVFKDIFVLLLDDLADREQERKNSEWLNQ